MTAQTCYTRSMPKLVCVSCHAETGAIMRKGLRVYDNDGFWSRPFNGILCGDCVAKARKLHSAKNRWLLQQIAEQRNSLPG
jgi:ribosomal protein L34E